MTNVFIGVGLRKKRLNEKKLYGLLLHNPYDLIGPHRDTLISILNELKSLELVKKIGVSIYDKS